METIACVVSRGIQLIMTPSDQSRKDKQLTVSQGRKWCLVVSQSEERYSTVRSLTRWLPVRTERERKKKGGGNEYQEKIRTKHEEQQKEQKEGKGQERRRM